MNRNDLFFNLASVQLSKYPRIIYIKLMTHKTSLYLSLKLILVELCPLSWFISSTTFRDLILFSYIRSTTSLFEVRPEKDGLLWLLWRSWLSLVHTCTQESVLHWGVLLPITYYQYHAYHARPRILYIQSTWKLNFYVSLTF